MNNTTRNTMTVAFLHDEFPCGGAERVTMYVAKYLAEKGCKVYVITSDFRKSLMPADCGDDVLEVLEVNKPHLQHSKACARIIASYINEKKVDILVFARTLHNLPWLKKQCCCKFVAINHGTPFWEIRDIETDRRRKAQRKAKYWMKWHLYYRWLYQYAHTLERKIERRYRYTIRHTDAYVTLCEEYKNEVVKRLHLPMETVNGRLHVIGNSCKRPDWVNTDKDREIVYVGRLTYADKRVDRLVRIWQMICDKVPEWHLTIVGDGDTLNDLKQQSVHLPRISFVGHQNDVSPYLQRAAILCLTSAIESWGLCLMEAQSYGVVPIAFNCSAGVRSLLAPSGKHGILVDDGNEQAYAEALLKLINDEEGRKLMQKQILIKSGDYDYKEMGKKWYKMFQTVLKQ